MKKIVCLLLSLAMLATMLMGCGNTPAQNGEENTNGPVKITMWHSNSGTNGEALQEIADAFNKSQSDYELELVYQGEYGDAFTKYKSTPAGSGPVYVPDRADAVHDRQRYSDPAAGLY